MKTFGILVALSASAYATPQPSAQPADRFFADMFTLCGKSFIGKLAAGDDSDASFATAKMQAHVRTCTDREIQISFDVGEDRSRTWIISRTDNGLRLKHRHMLKDGTEDPVSQYGGDTGILGTATRQEFPADAYSKAMFTKEGRTVSNTNVWAFEIDAGRSLTYELARPNRLFRVTFDVANPVTGASE
ncbi:hypothetical protein [Sphingorhabdus sp. EL138]|uniref:hypothetical protein n=1 Tax=Sphingorhabdus sp. EL138 TaxID=2073156 RepID=UPI0025E89274|nr:hypothetical protein [Sphingorhabdus sp. EL138]